MVSFVSFINFNIILYNLFSNFSLYVKLFFVILVAVCRCVCSRLMDDSDHDEQLAADAKNHVINDVSTGRLMTCTGLVEMPKYVSRGEIFYDFQAAKSKLDRCMSTESSKISDANHSRIKVFEDPRHPSFQRLMATSVMANMIASSGRRCKQNIGLSGGNLVTTSNGDPFGGGLGRALWKLPGC